MADKKISALTAATTPLAGTEVLPIVQSSSTVKVAVSDLTAGRAVSASSLSLTTPLSVANGGTGLATLTTNQIPYGAGTSAFSNAATFTYDGTTLKVGSLAGATSTAARFSTNQGGQPEMLIIENAANRNTDRGTSIAFYNPNGSGTTQLGAAVFSANESSTASGPEYLGFKTGTGGIITEKARIHSAGGLSVGTTTAPGAGNINANGSVIAAVNRTILGTAAVYDDTVNGNATGIGFGTDSVFPTNGAGSGSNNTKKLGNSSFRWSEVFAVTGTINTSDINAKQDIASLNDAEKRVAQRLKGLVKKYRFKDAVAVKGDDARTHVGFIAQEVEQAFADEGLDAARYGIFCRDVWYEVDGNALDDNKKAYTKDSPGAVEKVTVGLRYDQVFAFIICAL